MIDKFISKFRVVCKNKQKIKNNVYFVHEGRYTLWW